VDDADGQRRLVRISILSLPGLDAGCIHGHAPCDGNAESSCRVCAFLMHAQTHAIDECNRDMQMKHARLAHADTACRRGESRSRQHCHSTWDQCMRIQHAGGACGYSMQTRRVRSGHDGTDSVTAQRRERLETTIFVKAKYDQTGNDPGLGHSLRETGGSTLLPPKPKQLSTHSVHHIKYRYMQKRNSP
jgi:hypothetical protein